MPNLIIAGTDNEILIKPRGFNADVRNAIYMYLSSSRWDKRRAVWSMPRTAGSMWRLYEAIPHLEQAGAELQLDPSIKPCPAAVPSPTYDPIPDEGKRPQPPWRHQRGAFWHLLAAREALGSTLLDCGMRTGKTRMVLEHIHHSMTPRNLVITPTSVIDVWPEQTRKFGFEIEPRAFNDGTIARRVEETVEFLTGADAAAECRLAVIGWPVIERLTLEQKKSLREAISRGTIIADEVHYAKAPGSNRSKNLAFISTKAAMRIGASGTPLAHSPLDAYAVFRFLDPGIWGTSFGRFRDQFAEMGGYGNHQVIRFRNLDELARRMAPYTFRATRDVLELPDAQHNIVQIRLPESAWKIYQGLERECIAELSSGILAVDNALAKLLRLAQVASGHLPAADESGRVEEIHTEKRAALVDLFSSCEASEPWVVFSRFHYDLDETRRAAEQVRRPVYELSGRARELEDWRESCRNGEGPVLAAQIRSGGIGISLVEAAFCAYMSVGYSLDEYEQSLARIHGPEQTRPVAYYHIVGRGTVDVKIRAALEKRANVLGYVAQELINAQKGGRN